MKKFLLILLSAMFLFSAGCASAPAGGSSDPAVMESSSWGMSGTWYPVSSEYTTWYQTCKMEIGDLVDGKFHVKFYKDDELRFDEDVAYDAEFGARFVVEDPVTSWNNITMEIVNGMVGARDLGTRSGCRFEKR